jgi:hypothetical protein
MYPPIGEWDWVDGTITHFDMTEDFEACLQAIVDAHSDVGPAKSEFFHHDDPMETTDWEDFPFRWLTRRQDAQFHFPGPISAGPSESSFCLLLLLIS